MESVQTFHDRRAAGEQGYHQILPVALDYECHPLYTILVAATGTGCGLLCWKLI